MNALALKTSYIICDLFHTKTKFLEFLDTKIGYHLKSESYVSRLKSDGRKIFVLIKMLQIIFCVNQSVVQPFLMSQ